MKSISVIFRKWNNGDVIALFPEIPADISGLFCDSYEHIGQHGAAHYRSVILNTKPALPSEYASLFEELSRIYEPAPLKVCHRISLRITASYNQTVMWMGAL